MTTYFLASAAGTDLIRPDEVEYHSYKGRKPKASERDRAAEIVAALLDECWAMWRTYNDRR
jgi:hypothetical protein